jgi:hypothetical protein
MPDSSFTKAFAAFDKATDAFSEEMDEMFSSLGTMAEGGIHITSNNGHVVITGNVQSLLVNGKVIDIGASSENAGQPKAETPKETSSFRSMILQIVKRR